MPSRLATHQQKQFQKKIILYLILLFGLIFFMFSIGFRLLINASLFVSNLASGQKQNTTQDKKENFYGSLNIDNIPTATNSARIIVSGSITNYDQLQYFINGEKVKEVSYPTSDSFSQEIGDLKSGQNEVYVKAISKSTDTTRESAKYSVLYKNGKPKLEIKEPEDHAKTRKTEIKVAGNTDKEVYIKVNELPIVVNSDGAFQTSVQLKDGDNTIAITAEDSAGNTESKTLTVSKETD